MSDLQARIEELWANRDSLAPDDADANAAIHEAIDLLDRGEARVAEPGDDGVVVNEWLKLAILLLFKQSKMETIEVGPFEFVDKIPLKRDFAARGVRVVPGAQARWGSFQGSGVVMMPSYTNIGAYVGGGTMVDTWATVGSCAQIGRNVHLSGGVGIGGVLEPPNAVPVVVGDECLIGSRCIVAEGARVGDGEIPSWCVAVQATRPRTFPGGEFGLPCVLVLRRLEQGERHDKSALEGILRTHGVST